MNTPFPLFYSPCTISQVALKGSTAAAALSLDVSYSKWADSLEVQQGFIKLLVGDWLEPREWLGQIYQDVQSLFENRGVEYVEMQKRWGDYGIFVSFERNDDVMSVYVDLMDNLAMRGQR